MSARNINSCTEATTLIPCHLKINHHTVYNVAELASCLAEVFDSHEITGLLTAHVGFEASSKLLAISPHRLM